MFSCHPVAVLIYLGNSRFRFDLFPIVCDTALPALYNVDASRLQPPRGRGPSQRGLETDVEQRARSYRPAVYRNWASDRVQSSRDRRVLAVET